jgi:hypothetical protein
VAHGVNTPVKGVEVAMPHSDVDLPPRQAAREQLGERENTPLARCQPGDSEIRVRGRFGTYAVLN